MKTLKLTTDKHENYLFTNLIFSLMKNLVNKLTIVAVIVLFSTTAFSFSKKEPHRTNSGNNSQGITYVVNIDLSDAGSMCYPYIVIIRDENGNPVGPSREFTEGINTYVFHENGPVSGERSAHLERIPHNYNSSCNNIYYTQPHIIQGRFRNARTYIFELFPSDVPNNN